MSWNQSMPYDDWEVEYIISDSHKSRLCGIKAKHLKPYKEETNMKEIKSIDLNKLEQQLDEALAKETPESLNKWLDEENMEKRLEPVYELGTGKILYYLYYIEKVSGEKYCPIGETPLYIQDGYEFRDETNNVINAKRITLVRKQPQYPKTYEELSVPSTTEKFYIRIGDIPSNEKSKIYKGDSAIGEEDGVSVYNCIKLNNIYHIVMPLPLKEGQGITYENLIQEIAQCRYEIEKPRNVYLVSGMEIGKGHDNEPLIKDVKILKDLTGQFNTKNNNTEETKTLEKLVEPKFKDGDIVTCTNKNCTYTAIFKGMRDNDSFHHYGVLTDNKYCCMVNDWSDFNETCRLATEEEKARLFDVIKENGHRWNPETKTLEKLPKFKVGDRITDKNKFIYRITEITDKGYKLHDLKTTFITFEEADWYFVKVVDIFDIDTLIPFESRVLVRSSNEDIWIPAIYGFTDSDRYYIVGGLYWKKCIPYNEETKHLLGTTNDCDEYYKTWE